MSESMPIAEAMKFFSTLFGGKQHIPGDRYGEENLIGYGRGWSVILSHDLSTYDMAILTRLVFLAHDFAFRASVLPSGKRLQRIAIWKRERSGDQGTHHPTLEQAITAHRRHFVPALDAESPVNSEEKAAASSEERP